MVKGIGMGWDGMGWVGDGGNGDDFHLVRLQWRRAELPTEVGTTQTDT